ncbi:MAG: hypothetical protein SVZ03_14465 [Spirochaetota bacterium]|nr:hypothetical protein [Spirochaetota bacterium]
MKKLLTLVCMLFILIGLNGVTRFDLSADEKLVTIPLSISYSSIYWWRGTVLNDGAGTFWPDAECNIKDFSLSIAGCISEEWFTKNDSASEDTAKSFTEIDYGLFYSRDINDISLSAGVMFCHWPFYDEADDSAEDPSFWEASLSIGVDTILSPTLEFYYDYYIESYEGSYGKDVPTDEDYYIRFSVGHELINRNDNLIMSVGAWIGYYNDPYFEADGWSDMVALVGFSNQYNNLSFNSNFYYGRTLSKDFRDANDGIMNHFWCDFGISYSL